jgi:hypothetical protein
MRVVLQADMEGVAQIIDYRKCFPVYPAYWRTGRSRMTADVAAAAQGLFEGGRPPFRSATATVRAGRIWRTEWHPLSTG